jgi:hypothetical protein
MIVSYRKSAAVRPNRSLKKLCDAAPTLACRRDGGGAVFGCARP